MNIKTVADFDAALKNGPYAWPGGYPLFFVTHDGESLSFKSAKKNARMIREAIKSRDNTGGWRVVGVDTNWEDNSLYCADTGERIESAYADNPLSRVKIKSASMATGLPPSARLIKRRKKTAKAPPGIYANPKARTSFTKDSQRPRWSEAAGDYTQAASRRLVSRRKKTATAPKGFFANPVQRGTAFGEAKTNAEPRNLLQYYVQWLNSSSGQWRTVASFANFAQAKIYAHAFARLPQNESKTIRVATDD